MLVQEEPPVVNLVLVQIAYQVHVPQRLIERLLVLGTARIQCLSVLKALHSGSGGPRSGF